MLGPSGSCVPTAYLCRWVPWQVLRHACEEGQPLSAGHARYEGLPRPVRQRLQRHRPRYERGTFPLASASPKCSVRRPKCSLPAVWAQRVLASSHCSSSGPKAGAADVKIKDLVRVFVEDHKGGSSPDKWIAVLISGDCDFGCVQAAGDTRGPLPHVKTRSHWIVMSTLCLKKNEWDL